MKVIFGLVGSKESGKTTSLKVIQKLLPETEEVMLAGHLKACCALVFNKPAELFEDAVLKAKKLEHPLKLNSSKLESIFAMFEMPFSAEDLKKHDGKQFETPRQALQYIGTEVLRSKDDEIHLKWAMKNAKGSDVLVVSDIRFPNEFEFFAKQPGFISIGIKRETGSKDAHASELQIPVIIAGCENIIDNNGTKEDLVEAIRKIVIKNLAAKVCPE